MKSEKIFSEMYSDEQIVSKNFPVLECDEI